MPRIKIEQLQEGMVVASDVKNIDNMLLIPAGCTLTERQINVLQAWGVAEIEVQGVQTSADADPLAGLPPEETAKLSAELRDLFWQPDDSNPVFAEIFKLMLQRRARRNHQRET
jgi:hypothetical protein